MRVKHAMMLVVMGLVLQYASNVKAEELNLDFKLVNSTGWGIKEVYVAPNSSDDWGDSILKEPLKDGETLEVKFHPKATATKWDLKIVWVDGGKSVYWTGYKLTDIEKITLFYDEKTDKTSAKAE